jgi:hypothetical protein
LPVTSFFLSSECPCGVRLELVSVIQSPLVSRLMSFRRYRLVHLRLGLLAFVLLFTSLGVGNVIGQSPTPNAAPSATPAAGGTPAAATPVPTPARAAAKTDLKELTTAEQVVEASLLAAYAYGAGRALLNQIRKTTAERGQATYTGADGKVERANYQKFVIRGEALAKEKIRLDQEFPTARYALVYNDDKIYGIYNNTVFAPREDAARGFENQIVRGLEAFLRYKENGSTISMGPREKIMGVDYYVVDVTDKLERKTRFYVSAKSFRVLMLTYEENGVKYRRKFYDYNYAQGTLVPYRTVLWADDKIVEETEIGTITFGQKVDEELFKAG